MKYVQIKELNLVNKIKRRVIIYYSGVRNLIMPFYKRHHHVPDGLDTIKKMKIPVDCGIHAVRIRR